LNSKPYGSYRSAFAIGGSPSRQLPSFSMASPLIRERGIKILHVVNYIYPTSQLLKRLAKRAFKRLILTTPLCQHLLLPMSTNPRSVELNDSKCKKGQVTQQPPFRMHLPKAVKQAGCSRQQSGHGRVREAPNVL